MKNVEEYTQEEARMAFTVLRLFVLGARKVDAALIREAIKSSGRIVAERNARLAEAKTGRRKRSSINRKRK